MAEFVGVMQYLTSPTNFKQEALLFQRIAVPGLRIYLERLQSGLLHPVATINELPWLADEGVIFDPYEHSALADPLLTENAEYQDYLAKEREYSNPSAIFALDSDSDNPDRMDELRYMSMMSLAYRLRRISTQLCLQQNLDAVPVFSDHSSLSLKLSSAATKVDVVQLVLQKLPIPSDITAWEQIMDYRNDPDAYGKFAAIRQWMNEVARSQLTSLEISDKFEWLLQEYEQHMRLHKLTTNTGIVETIVVTTAEVLEGLVKLKWGEAAKKLFSLKQRQIALLEEETKAPGREVSYIIHARKNVGY